MQCLSVIVKMLSVQNTFHYLKGEIVENCFYVAQKNVYIKKLFYKRKNVLNYGLLSLYYHFFNSSSRWNS